MRIDAKLDVAKLVDKSAKAQKNLAYSVVQGLNATARQIQDAQRDALRKTFTLRTENTQRFLTRQIAIIKPFASVPAGRLYTEISVGERSKLLLSGYERGEDRPAFKGRMIAQPVTGNAARPSFSRPIAQNFTFRAMALKAKRTRAGAQQMKGKNRTYTIGGVGVFLRTGRGEEGSEMIYAFRDKQQLPKRLGWLKRARDIADKWLNENVTQAFLRSLPRN